jgi:hypothetical protein
MTFDEIWEADVKAPKAKRIPDRRALDSAKARAEALFKGIARELGNDAAQQILGELFREYAEPMAKKEIENRNNKWLLSLYDDYKWPVQKLARQLANLNKIFPFPVHGIRGGYTAKAIDRQLRRLLKKRGGTSGRRGRPASNKEGPDQRPLMKAIERFHKAEARLHKQNGSE